MTDIERRLRALSTPAPPGLLPAILTALSLEDEYTVVDGPAGAMYIAWNDRGVTACVPVTAVDGAFEDAHPRPVHRVEHPPDRIRRPLERALRTGRLGDLPVDLAALGEFQRLVLRKCAEIPPGEIRPYGWIAKEIGRPGAVRAVGTALARNPIPILIPCHRVVRTDGKIGRYAYGTEMKRELLRGEGVDPEAIEDLARRRVRYVGSATTRIYCYPTCRHAGRISADHRVTFRSHLEAEAAGFRACRVCRPAA